MPKKKKMSEDELSELLQKSLKEAKPEIDLAESNEEEKHIDEDIELQSLEFHQFMGADSSEAGSPALERIAGSQTPRPIFVGGIPQGPATATNGESGNDFKYMPGAENSNEPKYLGPQEGIRGGAERVNFEDVGRRQEFFPKVNQDVFFEGASEVRGMGFNSPATERFERAERFDVEKAGRDQFERPEAKYEKYKPKLPSGR